MGGEVVPVAEVERRLHGAHKDRPAVRVDGMVPRVGRVEEVRDAARDGRPYSRRSSGSSPVVFNAFFSRFALHLTLHIKSGRTKTEIDDNPPLAPPAARAGDQGTVRSGTDRDLRIFRAGRGEAGERCGCPRRVP